MKKNAQSVEAWLEAMIAVARYYRLDFSPGERARDRQLGARQ